MERAYTATLPPAPGINATYRFARAGNRTRVYLSERATEWSRSALLLFRAAGVRPLPAGAWSWSIALEVHTIALDCDGPLKLCIDVAAEALDVDDRYLHLLSATKYRVHHRRDERLVVRLVVTPADGDDGADVSTLTGVGV